MTCEMNLVFFSRSLAGYGVRWSTFRWTPRTAPVKEACGSNWTMCNGRRVSTSELQLLHLHKSECYFTRAHPTNYVCFPDYNPSYFCKPLRSRAALCKYHWVLNKRLKHEDFHTAVWGSQKSPVHRCGFHLFHLGWILQTTVVRSIILIQCNYLMLGMLTCMLFTDWNRTKRRGICFPILTSSSDNWSVWATSGSWASCTSSNPIDGRLTRIFMTNGPWDGWWQCILRAFILTIWWNCKHSLWWLSHTVKSKTDWDI